MAGIPRHRTQFRPIDAGKQALWDRKAGWVGLWALGFGLGGCIFAPSDPKVLQTDTRYESLDEIVSNATAADREVELFLPLLNPELGEGAASRLETLSAVTVREHASGEVVRYRRSRQSFGSWSAVREYDWNRYHLQTQFLRARDLEGLALPDGVDSLYARAHDFDAYTRYYSGAAKEEFLKAIFTTDRKAVGLMLRQNADGDTLYVRLVAAGSPADRAGVEAGMALLALNDETLTGDSAFVRFENALAAAVEADSAASLDFRFASADGILDAELAREEVSFPSVIRESFGNTAVIAVLSFTETTLPGQSTLSEMRAALEASASAERILIDLRGNGGGSLGLALAMADLFQPEGVSIRQEQREVDGSLGVPLWTAVTHKTRDGGPAEGKPVHVLVDGGTASASEVLVAALSEGVGARVYGTRTYGKGVGQTVVETPGGGLAIVTHVHFLTAAGVDYDGVGLEPDRPLAGTGEEALREALADMGTEFPEARAKVAAGSGTAYEGRLRVWEWNRRQALRPGIHPL